MTGEMGQIDPITAIEPDGTRWPYQRAIAAAVGGTVKPFDKYQGPYAEVHRRNRRFEFWASAGYDFVEIVIRTTVAPIYNLLAFSPEEAGTVAINLLRGAVFYSENKGSTKGYNSFPKSKKASIVIADVCNEKIVLGFRNGFWWVDLYCGYLGNNRYKRRTSLPNVKNSRYCWSPDGIIGAVKVADGWAKDLGMK